MTIALVVLAYLACCFGAWGLTLGYFTHRFPFFHNQKDAFGASLLGPFGLLAVSIISLSDYRRLWWRVVPMTEVEIRAAHEAEWPRLKYTGKP